MNHRILLTCFGSKIALDFIHDFDKRDDIELSVGDANPTAPISYCTARHLPLLNGADPAFGEDLLQKAQDAGIEMIVPGGDEDALALMVVREEFERGGITVAVQNKELLPVFQSKTSQYEHLRSQGVSVPAYERVRTSEEFTNGLQRLGYPDHPLVLKPNFGRGGNGIFLIFEKIISNKDGLPIVNQQFARQLFNGKIEYILMRYIEGVIYDVDVLRYQDGRHWIGIRKRLGTNVTKLFAGNTFGADEAMVSFCEQVYRAMPTEYLVDYDVMLGNDGSMELLEINPRPSGSTISYLPFGINLYYILAKSYLDSAHIGIDVQKLAGRSAHTFYTMIKEP